MNFKINLITLALLTNAGIASATDSYDISQANTENIKFAKWKCKGCTAETGYSGTIRAGMGYNDDDGDIHAANAFHSENEFAGKVDADVRYRGENGNRVSVEADDLGLENGRIDINVGKESKYNINVNYRQIATYDTDSALSPYLGSSGGNMVLPSNWVTAGSSDSMPMLNSSLNPLELSLKRERTGLGFEYQGDKLWSTYVNYLREEKKGAKTASGSFYNQSMMLAEPVDYTTDTLEAGIKLRGDNWFTALTYNGSFFNNEIQELSFENAFNPTFGAQTVGYMSVDPDNESHTVTLSGQFNQDGTVVTGRMLAGEMTQDEQFTTSGYGYSLPSESLDGKVDMLGMNIKVSKKATKKMRFTGSYDYYDRDNQTQVQAWNQISISSVSGQVAYNTPYDNTRQKLKFEMDYRIGNGMKFVAGYNYRNDERSYQDREETEESTVWARFNLNTYENWNLWVKGSYGNRDGSRYEASQWTSSEQNDLMLKYNIADRERTMFETRITHTPLDNLSIDLGARYAFDDYDETIIGLTESKDTSYDINVNYMFTKNIAWDVFYNYQTIKTKQNGSSSFSSPTWNSDIEDQIDLIGTGLSYNNLLENKLRLGIDYTYSDSDSNTQVRQGITGDYGDYYAKVHNLNFYAQYQATEKMAFRFDYMMENYEDNDAANDLEPDSIWNIVSFGDTSHDYTANFIMLSMEYSL